jgi:hypothetical protein
MSAPDAPRLQLRASGATWLLRLALLLALGGCCLISARHFASARTLVGCLASDDPGCIGATLQTTRFLHAVGRRPGGTGWTLSVDGHQVVTDAALPGVAPGDRVEARVTLRARGVVTIHSYVCLSAARLRVRLGISLAASALILLLLLRRYRRHRRVS